MDKGKYKKNKRQKKRKKNILFSFIKGSMGKKKDKKKKKMILFSLGVNR
jgi:hypothetical protein